MIYPLALMEAISPDFFSGIKRTAGIWIAETAPRFAQNNFGILFEISTKVNN